MDIFEAVDAREANGAVFIISQVDYFSFLRVNNVKMLLNCDRDGAKCDSSPARLSIDEVVGIYLAWDNL